MSAQYALQHAQSRLAANQFEFLQPGGFGPTFRMAARRSKWAWSKFGFFEEFFVFAELPWLDIAQMQAFSANAFRYALGNKKIGLPCGVCEAVVCYSVALAQNPDPALVASIRSTTPPKHWSAFEMPVVWDLQSGNLYCLEKTPIWGAAYYGSFRTHLYRYLTA
jgi:hypothetical protein